MRSSSTQQKPAQRTHPATIIQLIRLIEQPVARRPEHAVRFLRIACTAFASELTRIKLGSKHGPVGVAPARAVVGQADRATPIPTASISTLDRPPVQLADTITALISDEPAARAAEVRPRRRQVGRLLAGRAFRMPAESELLMDRIELQVL